MGFKLTGIAIDKNFEKDLAELFGLLNISDFSFEKNSTFDEETFDILDDDNISIGFFGKGTFISTGIELMTNDELLKSASKNQRIASFYVSDTTSTYCFDYYFKGEYLRKKWISHSDKNIDSSDNFGEPLPCEKDADDDLDNVLNVISFMLGKNFYEIEESAPMSRFEKKS
jgi:hypothetical protein